MSEGRFVSVGEQLMKCSYFCYDTHFLPSVAFFTLDFLFYPAQNTPLDFYCGGRRAVSYVTDWVGIRSKTQAGISRFHFALAFLLLPAAIPESSDSSV